MTKDNKILISVNYIIPYDPDYRDSAVIEINKKDTAKTVTAIQTAYALWSKQPKYDRTKTVNECIENMLENVGIEYSLRTPEHIDVMLDSTEVLPRFDYEKTEENTKDKQKIELSELSISDRLYNVLRRGGFKYVSDLETVGPIYLLKYVRFFGVKSLEELQKALTVYGVYL